MSQIELTPPRERRVARGQSLQIQLVVSRLHLAVHGMPTHLALIAMNEVLEDLLGKPHSRVYVMSDGAAAPS